MWLVLEEIAYHRGFVDAKHLRKRVIQDTPNSPYKDYLKSVLDDYWFNFD
ncbi:MAG: hypothetical protein R2827_13585 [Bdellovibrionales bacterium]